VPSRDISPSEDGSRRGAFGFPASPNAEADWRKNFGRSGREVHMGLPLFYSIVLLVVMVGFNAYRLRWSSMPNPSRVDRENDNAGARRPENVTPDADALKPLPTNFFGCR
jgi:hypothetical protein